MERETPNTQEFFCPYKDCPDYGKIGQGNITLSHRYGHQKTYLLWCKSCKRTFSENRGTLFKLRTPKKKILQAIHCIAEGNTISSTARIMGTNEDTVSRWLKKAAEHSKLVDQYLVRNLKLSQAELDELWSYIKKRRRT